MPIIFLPGIIGLTSLESAMLVAIIPLPASPNPRANNPPIFIMVFSRMFVS
jgi:hypothetical protein